VNLVNLEWVKTYVHGKIVAWREDNAVSDCAAETAARGFDWQLSLHGSILYLIRENASLEICLLFEKQKKDKILEDDAQL
jgi:hypothetical protein